MTSGEVLHIVAFIRPFQLAKVTDALRVLPNFPGMSVSDGRGFGSHLAHPPAEGERGEVHPFKEFVRIEIFCRGTDEVAITETILHLSHTGHRGDGKIFVSSVRSARRIRTGDWGDSAVLKQEASGAKPEQGS